MPWLEPELAALEAQYPVRYDAAARLVVIEDVGLPPGYTPRRITVRLKVPETYPRAAPRAEVPWDLRFEGRVPRHLLSSGQWLVRGHLGDPFVFFPAWEHRDNLQAVLEAVLDDLATTAPLEREGCDG